MSSNPKQVEGGELAVDPVPAAPLGGQSLDHQALDDQALDDGISEKSAAALVDQLADAGGSDADGADDDESDDDKRRVRARTMSRKQMAREHRKQRARGELLDIVDYWRPKTRSDCLTMERPCLYVSCRFHLYLDVNPETGSVKMNFPDKEIWELEDTCALDVADRGGITLEEVGAIMNLTRERIRQVEVRGLEKLKETPEGLGGLDVYADWDPYDASDDF